MPDLQVLTFDKGVPTRYADINLPLNTDGTFGQDGPVFLSDLDKAIQDLVKGLLTQVGSNGMAPNYGTSLKTLLNARNVNNIGSDLLSQIQALLGYLGTFNANQPLSERIDQIASIKTTQGLQSINLEITLRTGSGSTATVTLI